MTANRFLSAITLCFTLLSIGPAYGAEETYVVSYTNGRNDLGFFDLVDNGTTFQAGQRFFFTSSARIGTTSPKIDYIYGWEIRIYHTFADSNGLTNLWNSKI